MIDTRTYLDKPRPVETSRWDVYEQRRAGYCPPIFFRHGHSGRLLAGIYSNGMWRQRCSTKQQRRVTDASLQDKNLSCSNRHSQMLEQYRQTILNAFREVADLLVALQTRGEQLASQHQEVQAAQEARELADIRYRKGLVTYLDVLDAELTLVQTERARLTDMVGLFKAVGGGWANEQLVQVQHQ